MFIKTGSLVPFGGPILRREILANSITVTQMDAVRVDTDGFLALGTAGTSVFGHVISVGTNLGVGLNTTGVAGAEMGSFVGTFLTASDNETVAKVRAEVDISQFTLYSGSAAAGTFGTTTAGSGELGAKFDLSDEDDLNETSIVVTTAQYVSWGLNPDGTNTVIVNIFEHQFFNDSQTAA